MDESEFREAEENMHDLIAEYQQAEASRAQHAKDEDASSDDDDDVVQEEKKRESVSPIPSPRASVARTANK